MATTGSVSLPLNGPKDSGVVTLSSGTVTVSSVQVQAGSVILLSTKAPSGTQGTLSVGTIVAATSFVINSTSGTEASTVSWVIF